jgi:hypothetical protein
VEHVVQFDATRRTLPALDMGLAGTRDGPFGSAGVRTGAAWLSSARVVRCWVKSRNERNPRLQLPSGNAGHFGETAGDKPEEGGDDVKSSWPLRAGLHTCYNGGDSGMRRGDPEPIPKSRPSSDCTLQLECMKVESLVIADQHAAVNTFPGLVHTARHAMGVGSTRRRCANRKEAAGHGRINDWGEVVTR